MNNYNIKIYKGAVIQKQPKGKEKVIYKNLTLKQANEYFYGIDNTYIREQKETKWKNLDYPQD